jgi:hypothetical protein
LLASEKVGKIDLMQNKFKLLSPGYIMPLCLKIRKCSEYYCYGTHMIHLASDFGQFTSHVSFVQLFANKQHKNKTTMISTSLWATFFSFSKSSILPPHFDDIQM